MEHEENYHYLQESEQYSFYRIPKALFENDRYKDISTDSKLLYGLMLDRMDLSVKNRWIDEKGRVYIFFTVKGIMDIMKCSNRKVTKLLSELDTEKGVGLIKRVRRGQGNPDKIYVMKFIQNHHFKKCNIVISESDEKSSAEVLKGHTNHTDINHTEKNNTEDIYKHTFGEQKNVLLTDDEYHRLMIQFPYDYRERIENLSDYIAATGKRYKNHYATIRMWNRMERMKNNKNPSESIKNDKNLAESVKDYTGEGNESI